MNLKIKRPNGIIITQEWSLKYKSNKEEEDNKFLIREDTQVFTKGEIKWLKEQYNNIMCKTEKNNYQEIG